MAVGVSRHAVRLREPLEPGRGVFASGRDRQAPRGIKKSALLAKGAVTAEPDYQEAKVSMEELEVTGDSLIPEA
jgi:hypothetical protein